MQILPVDPGNRWQIRQFLDLPFRLYASTPQWVPPLSMEASKVFNQRHPYYFENAAEFYLALDHRGQTLGRLAVLDNRRYNHFNHESTAFFTLFECINDTEVAQALFQRAFAWARKRGLNQVAGPKGFSVFDGQGMLVKGFERRPAFGLPYNLEYYSKLVEVVGFKCSGELVSGYLSANIRFPEKVLQIADILMTRRGLSVARFRTRKELRSLVPMLRDLYNNSLAGTTGNVPLTEEEARELGEQLIWFANPRLIKIVLKKDQPVGFLFAYPDISAAIQRIRGQIFPLGWVHLLLELRRTKWININGAGMIEGYRGLGGTALLFSEMYKSVVDEGYQHAELVQIGVENERMQRELRDLGINFYKSHRTYHVDLSVL